MSRLDYTSDLRLSRRRMLGLALSAGAGVGAAAALWPPRGFGKSILSLIGPVGAEPYQRTIACMGTFVSIAVHDHNGECYSEAVDEALAEVRAVDALMSTFRPESEISSVNRAAGRESVRIDPRVAEVLRAARRMGEHSDGTFDVTVLPLLRTFGLRGGTPGEEPRRPSLRELRIARAQVDYRAIDVDPARPVAGLELSGAEVDLGGIAKGYAVDRAAEVLHARGVRQAVINAGGDLRVTGAPGRGDDDGWRVGVQDPLHPGRILATLELRDQAIATSGNYEQFIDVGEERLGHLIDPKSGRPATPMLSATVVAPTAMQADAASTTAFLMGSERGARFVRETEGAESLFSVNADGISGSTTEVVVRASSGITGLTKNTAG